MSIWFIPTHVGKTLCKTPQGCSKAGSSPHAWGIPSTGRNGFEISRFSPTHVRNTLVNIKDWCKNDGSSPRTWGIRFVSPLFSRSLTVHPHGSGADSLPLTTDCIKNGSSPLMWGHSNGLYSHLSMCGSSPMSVGETIAASIPTIIISVHPHECGGYEIPYGHTIIPIGSAPRPWGYIGKSNHRAM